MQVPQAVAMGSLPSLQSASSLARSIFTSLASFTPHTRSPAPPTPLSDGQSP